MEDSDSVLRDCHCQAQSPLFSKLPGEIRNHVFELALARSEDKNKPYRKDAYYYRPGYTCEHRSDLRLLRTCRRIYAEARHLPLQNMTATLWFEGDERRPPGQSNDVYRRRLGQFAAARVDSVHVLAQMYWLENYGLGSWFGADSDITHPARHVAKYLKHLTVTIRHTDWWLWEQVEPLQIHSEWLEYYVAPESLQDFKLELEVPSRKAMELDTLVNSLIRRWTFEGSRGTSRGTTSLDGTIFSTKRTMPTVDTWTGGAVFDGENREPERTIAVPSQPHLSKEEGSQGPVSLQPETIDYVVVTLTWLPFMEEPTNFTWQPAKGGLKWEPVAGS